MKVPFTYTTKIYKISLDILVIFIVYNSIKFSILKKTYKHLKILSGNATLETAVIYGFYEWLSSSNYHVLKSIKL